MKNLRWPFKNPPSRQASDHDPGGEQPNPNITKVFVAGDNPIRRSEDDTLGRGNAARSFAQQVLALDGREGLVVGVLGAWGSGKTSFMNLAREEFERGGAPILDFNPWMFSGAQQLVDSFFFELAAQLKIRPDLAEVGKELEEYGETFSGMVWLPLLGPWIERARSLTKLLNKLAQLRKEGIGGKRARVEKALADLNKPILVVLDDIDRLSTSEIRDVFKLVRLTASFPNIIYIVAFDRGRVEQALAEQGVLGRDYLEKILQVAVDLPVVPSQVLDRQIFSAVDGALAAIEKVGPFDQDVWPDIFGEVIRPLIRNMRDVRRYAAAVHGTVVALDGQIALADVLALEAIRVFLPDVFGQLACSVRGLTTISGFTVGDDREPPQLKSQIVGLIEAAGAQANVVRAMIKRLFPAGEHHIGGSHYGDQWEARWLRKRRVAHENILRFYLERVVGEGLLAFKDAEQALVHMADRDAFETYLGSIDPARRESVIASLEVYEEEFAPEQVVPSTIVLLNLLPGLPERPRGMLEPSARLVVARVIYRLLRSLNNPAAVEASMRQILPELNSLSAKLELIGDVGYREGRGQRLVSEAAAAEFETAWRDEVRGRSVHDLANETDLVRILLVAKREADPSEAELTIDEAPQLTLAILRAAWSEVRSQTLGSRAVRRSARLAWDVLIELYGNEATLKDRIESLKATGAKEADDLVGLAERYLRDDAPRDFDND